MVVTSKLAKCNCILLENYINYRVVTKPMTRVAYVGSFDPITSGHFWVIRELSKLLQHEIVVAATLNPGKNHLFSLEKRVELMKRSLRDLPNVKVDSFDGEYTVDYAKRIGADYLIRGMRGVVDFDNEKQMRHINEDINPDITTLFIMPKRDVAEISSSLVKGLVGPTGWERAIERYLPRQVYNAMLTRFRGFEKQWNSLWQRINAQGDPKEVYDQLLSMYSEEQRWHHGMAHLAYCLNKFGLIKQYLANPGEAEMALWMHEAFYNPRARDNEERSADFASKVLGKAMLKAKFVNGVVSRVQATDHRTAPRNTDTKYVVDIDKAILGEAPLVYVEYKGDIRQEYIFYAPEVFREGRITALEKFSERHKIFDTDFFRKRFENSARENISAELKELKVNRQLRLDYP